MRDMRSSVRGYGRLFTSYAQTPVLAGTILSTIFKYFFTDR